MTTRITCLVTGGGGPVIGSGVCSVLASKGYRVAVADRDLDAAEAVASDIRARGGEAVAVQLDVVDADAVSTVVQRLSGEYGGIGALVNSAGIGLDRRIADVEDADFDRIMSVNLRGAWLTARAVIPGMVAAGGGSIVNIGSVHASASETGYGVYAASKAGLAAMSRAIARDYGPLGIRSNVVHPGMVAGREAREEIRAAGRDPEEWLLDHVQRRQMLPRQISPTDIGRAVAFLLGDDALAITGAELAVDCGMSAMLV